MNSSIPLKSELRRGKFKKILLDERGLRLEAAALHEKLQRLFQDYQNNILTSAEYCALWLVTYLRTRQPYGWWGAHRKEKIASHKLTKSLREYPYFDFDTHETHKLQHYDDLGDLLNFRAFRATPLPVNRAILSWSQGEYDLVLMDRIPSVQEVLEQQVQGKRCVTLFHQLPRLSALVLGERDPLSFGLHDLIHADHFFHANYEKTGQIGFYRIIHQIFHSSLLDDFMQIEGFEGRLEYLMADMNSHPLHLWKCFKAICDISFKERSVHLFQNDLPSLLATNPLETQSLRLINSDEFKINSHGVAITKLCQSLGV